MSTNQRRVAGKRAFPKDTKPALRLVRPASECSTADLVLNTSREVKEMLREMDAGLIVIDDDKDTHPQAVKKGGKGKSGTKAA